MAVGLIAGGVLGGLTTGLLESEGHRQARTFRRRARRRQFALSNVFQSALSSDPLLNQILGGAAGAAGQGAINSRQIFQDASVQVGEVSRRREGDALRTLAAFGVSPHSAQAQFLARSFNRSEVRQLGDLRNLIDQTAIQTNPQLALEAAGQNSQQLLGQQEIAVGGIR